MPWIRRKLRNSIVFVKVDDAGVPASDRSGRVDIVYKLVPNAKVYRASARNLEPTGEPADERPFSPGDGVEPGSVDKAVAAKPPAVPDGAIVVYTDGACIGNPGPMGIGAVIIDGSKRHEISEFLGRGTNNIAELTAIERALESIEETDRNRPIIIHSDSSYSLGLLEKNWKAKANVELVARLRKLASRFGDLRYVKVKGHAGIPENERCDELAGLAIEDQATSR